MIDQFQRWSEMIAICDHNFGVILIQTYCYRFVSREWIDLLAIDNGPDVEKTQ